ncbi:active regulator of SIRT1 [Procambarus clarkii]|uniref:active regulator of SIRT1 n=1 Tax=Procambarus clarkii TaxID=6728 RepID=UPI00374236D0
MSWSLVNRGLDLFDSDLSDKSSCQSNVNGSAKSVNVSTQRHGIKKAAKQKQKAQARKKKASTQLIQKQVASALDEYKKYAHVDRTRDNIKFLKKIDKKRAPAEYIEQIASHHSKELDRKGGCPDLGQGQKSKKRGSEEASVFTDEDFEKMNKEWLRLY